MLGIHLLRMQPEEDLYKGDKVQTQIAFKNIEEKTIIALYLSNAREFSWKN
jgi:copper(I)-binding protein